MEELNNTVQILNGLFAISITVAFIGIAVLINKVRKLENKDNIKDKE